METMGGGGDTITPGEAPDGGTGDLGLGAPPPCPWWQQSEWQQLWGALDSRRGEGGEQGDNFLLPLLHSLWWQQS